MDPIRIVCFFQVCRSVIGGGRKMCLELGLRVYYTAIATCGYLKHLQSNECGIGKNIFAVLVVKSKFPSG